MDNKNPKNLSFQEISNSDNQIQELKTLLLKLEEQELFLKQTKDKNTNQQPLQQKQELPDELKMQDFLTKAKYSLAKKELLNLVERENANIKQIQQQKQSYYDKRLRQSHNLQEYKQLNPIDQALQEGKPIPIQYRFLWENNQQGQTPLNIGTKMTNMIEESTQRKIKLQNSLRQSRGLYIWNNFRQGKMGVDAYFIFFAIVGISIIPYFIFNHLKPQKNFIQNTLGITKENFPDFWEQNKYDLDEISIQKTYYTMYSKEIEAEKEAQIRIATTKQLIENQLRNN